MKLEEATREEKLIIKLWDEWLRNPLDEEKNSGITKEKANDLLEAYFNCIGEIPPNKNTPITLMFLAFAIGVNRGVGLVMEDKA